MFNKRIGTSALLLALFTFLIGAVPALAFMPAEQNDSHEIPLPNFNVYSHDGYDRDMGSALVENALEARYDGIWRVNAWNAWTGTPHFVYGTSVKLTDGISSVDQLEQQARSVIADNADVLKADLNQLRFLAGPNGMGKWAAHFQQTYHGIDVHQARTVVLFSEDGKLMLMGSDYYDDITVDPNPSISKMSAIDIARSAVPFNPSTDLVQGEGELLVLPYPLSETEVEHHLVWRVRVHTEDPLGDWVTHVDAHTGDIIWRYNDIHFAYSGDAEADTYEWGYCDGAAQTRPMPDLRIDVDGLGSVVTDADGNWDIGGSGGNRTVSCDMEGPLCDVYDNLQYPEAFFSGTAQDGVPFTVFWDDTNSHQDERDVMDGVTEVQDFISQFDPGFGYINQQMRARVSLNSTCNAYWNGEINFYREGGGCANTGEMHQVVHHEFGHGVQAYILGSQGNEGLGEGNSDILGNLITQDNIIGRGFYLNNCTSGIRNSVNNLQYPEDLNGQVHHDGQIIAGFNWDAMVLLQDAYGGGMNWDGLGTVMSGERWHFGRVLGHPFNQQDQVTWTFIADDDNGDLGDGTPNHAIFCEAAENHGYECPEILVGVFIYHDGSPYTGDQWVGYDVAGTVVSLGGGVIDPSTVVLHYRVNGGGYTQIPMSDTGNPDEYGCTIPAQSWGSVVEYYIYAENTLDMSGTSPADAPSSLHYFEVNENFVDEMETDTAWQGHIFGDNAGTGRWERGDPVGTNQGGAPLQPEDDHTAAGTDCWATGLSTGGSAGGNDVDGGTTTLLSPMFDLSGATAVNVTYYRWFSNDLGNCPGDDPWVVQVTNDGGNSWIDIENTLTDNEAWMAVSFDLFDYVPSPEVVQFRFVARDDGPCGGSLVEAAVDDFSLLGAFGGTGVDDDDMTVKFITAMDQNYPNPFNPKTEISFSLEQAGPASLRVFDASGRLVKVLSQGNLAQGEHRVVWNGDDESGTPVSSGVYFYKLDAEGKNISRRMVLLK